MSESKHTPGPWKWQDWCCYGDPDAGPSKQTLVGPEDTREGIHAAHLKVLFCEEMPRNPADMALIAAVPDLLAVAELARETAITILGEVHSGNASDDLRETLRAWAQDLFRKSTDAVAKAKGGA